LILDEAGFNSRISSFFSNYLIDRKTQYIWNNFVSSSFSADVGVDQGLALSLPSYPLFILLLFFTFLKKGLKIFYQFFPFPFFHG